MPKSRKQKGKQGVGRSPSLPPPLYFSQTAGGRAALEGKGRAGHSQKIDDRLMTCPNCNEGNCTECVDRLRMLYRQDRICTCSKSGHEDAMMGEPRRVQIEDPFTGDIHGPDLRVTKGGQVIPGSDKS
jgi:hypothetical protein